MCGRYTLSTTAELVEEVFGADAPEDMLPRWNIAPSEPAAVVRPAADGGRRLDLLRWGLARDRSAPVRGGDRSSGGLHINARAETVATLPAFRDGFRERRCLVPADGFYEWGEGRQARHVRFRDRRPFAMAGLWAPADRLDTRTAPESFAILTCPPSDLVRPLHDRMPVILPNAVWDEWLVGEDLERLLALLVPWKQSPGSELELAPVGPYVNRAGNEGPECLAPPPPPTPPAQRSLFS
jgi:putative SOS response-associated peptidase YedK